ncbi:N-acetylneuraminate synthase family protein [Ruminococcus albus]|uniref:N-acetylneuraminate synthase n=1 Tax=Ruminococcus albus TaxID=1264 RepID=A0A1I1RHK1_RUMAL|nr:N-acetylneuraminate synthase family protein [Ruminococcus albus]SFD31728.1 N-acetylneuraminate synthase [Ruminococcus albus]
MKSSFYIGDLKIGIGEEPLVIPEMGINHEGSLDVAMSIVDAAARAGAKVIKHQTHVVEDEMSHAAKKVIPGNTDVSIYEVMERCALSEDEEYELMRYVESKGMIFISTPFSRAAADRLHRFNVKAYKIGSGELNNYPLIKHIASFGKPMIVSTGMNNIESIRKAVNIMEDAGVPYALLHTTNLYPTVPNLVRLGAMQEMMETFPNIPIGLSDHTLTNTACISAITLGASIVERHFIDRKDRPGPDVICSMDEKECAELIIAARDVPQMLGGKKEAAKEEKVTIDFAFATVVTIKSVKAGEMFTKENLWVKRPGTGEILAEKYESILGKKSKVDIDNDTQLKWSMIDNI